MTSCERSEASWWNPWISQERPLNFSAHCIFSFLCSGLFEEKVTSGFSRPDSRRSWSPGRRPQLCVISLSPFPGEAAWFIVRICIINDVPLLRGSSFGPFAVQMKCLTHGECCLTLVFSSQLSSIMWADFWYFSDWFVIIIPTLSFTAQISLCCSAGNGVWHGASAAENHAAVCASVFSLSCQTHLHVRVTLP